MSNATEDVLTHELYEVLSDEKFDKEVVGGFNRELFSNINRESKVRSYNHVHVDKMPDLLIGLVGRQVCYRSQDWIYIECKPVDSAHAVGKHYCGMGIIRFVRGEYAWTMTSAIMTSAIMIAYVRKAYTIAPKLTDALKTHEVGSLGEPCAVDQKLRQ